MVLDLFHKILIKFGFGDVDKTASRNKAVNGEIITVSSKVYHLIDKDKKTIRKRLNNFILKCLCKLPIYDYSQQFLNITEYENTMNYYFRDVLLKKQVVYYKNVANELSMMSPRQLCVYMATNGPAAHLLKYNEIDDEYVVDLSYMVNLEVRKGLLKYGAKLILSNEYDVKYIIVSDGNQIYAPYDTNWQYAYNIFISSLITHITLYDHAIVSHFLVANNMAVAQHKFSSNVCYDLLNMLNPFLYKTLDVNESALKILVNKRGLIYRVFGLTEKATEKYMKYMMDYAKYDGLLECVYKSKIDGSKLTPFHKDAILFWTTVENFVIKYIDAIFGENKIYNVDEFVDFFENKITLNNELNVKEKLIKILTSHIFVVSFWHEYVGNMTPYVLHPKIIKTKVYAEYPNAVYESKQGAVQSANLALLTSIIDMPKITDYLGKNQNKQYTQLWEEFQESMINMEFETCHFYSDLIECSISL